MRKYEQGIYQSYIFLGMSNVPPLEVVGRGSEAQLQVVENLGKIAQQEWG